MCLWYVCVECLCLCLCLRLFLVEKEKRKNKRKSSHVPRRRSAAHCNAVQRTATHCNTRTATYCSTLQHTHCNTLQHAHCNTLPNTREKIFPTRVCHHQTLPEKEGQKKKKKKNLSCAWQKIFITTSSCLSFMCPLVRDSFLSLVYVSFRSWLIYLSCLCLCFIYESYVSSRSWLICPFIYVHFSFVTLTSLSFSSHMSREVEVLLFTFQK